MSRAAGFALLLATGLAAPASHAVEIHSVDVQHDEARYRVSMRVTLDAPAAAAYTVFADLPRLREINPSVREVSVLETLADGTRRVYTDIRTCAGLYCRHLKQVQDMRFAARSDGGRVHAQVLPERSDFRFGDATWDFRNCEGRTCLAFDAELEPAFWVPPLLGPWLIKRKLQEEAIETSKGLERRSHALSVAP